MTPVSADPLLACTSPAIRARRQLALAAKAWFIATAMGQVLFALFIVLFYYTSTLSGSFAAWDDKDNITGYEAGDSAGNLVFAIHVLLAAAMTLAGLIQLVPAVRARWPKLHRWSGRSFLTLAFALSLSGLWLVWGRGSYLTITGAFAISLDAALILSFGFLAWRAAVARDFVTHRRWALRTFIVASGVWFMRIGYITWAVLTGGAGITAGMSGPFDLFWAFATHLLPLAVLELYLKAQRGTASAQRWMAGGLWLLALLMLGGSGGAWLLLWGPNI
jgi:hypothetical protein